MVISISGNSIVTSIEKLNGTNYRQWKYNIQMLLEDCDIWGFVELTETELVTTDEQIFDHLKAAGTPVLDRELVFTMLMGLPDDYDHIMSQFIEPKVQLIQWRLSIVEQRATWHVIAENPGQMLIMVEVNVGTKVDVEAEVRFPCFFILPVRLMSDVFWVVAVLIMYAIISNGSARS
ncbi:hypothetical protein CHUAL_012002 [Chamberlinius hualienensis]